MEYSQQKKGLNHAVQMLTEHFSTEEVETFGRMLEMIRESLLEEPG